MNFIELSEDRLFFIISIGFAIAFFVFERVRSRREKKTTALGFIENKCITLFSPLIETVDGLKITYKRKSVSNNLIIYQATIFNSGVSDITDISIYKPLTLKLPHEFVWKSFKIYDQSEGVSIKHSIDKTNLKIEWDLFKKGEFFRFDSVIEYVNVETDDKKNVSDDKVIDMLSRNISFNDSRISNLEVKRQNLKVYEAFLRWGKTLIYYSIIMLSLKLIVFDKTETIVYDVKLDSIPTQIEFTLNSDREIVLVDSLNNKYLLDSLKNDLVIANAQVIEKEDLNFKDKTYPRVMIVLSGIMLFFLYEQKRLRNKREKMNLVSPGNWDPYKEEDC